MDDQTWFFESVHAHRRRTFVRACHVMAFRCRWGRMLLIATVAVVWAAVGFVVVGMCVAAKRGDQAQADQPTFVLATAATPSEAPAFKLTPALESASH